MINAMILDSTTVAAKAGRRDIINIPLKTINF